MADHERSSLARKSEGQESLLRFGMIRVVVRVCQGVVENGGGFFEADAMLRKIGRRLLGVPLEEHQSSLAADRVAWPPAARGKCAVQQDAAADGRLPWLLGGAARPAAAGRWLTRRRPPVDTRWYTGGRI